MTDITPCTTTNACNETINRSSNILSAFAGSAYQKIKAFLAMRRQHSMNRDALNHLMRLDEKSLKDIGISRDDVRYVSKLALHKNAAHELEKIRAQNIATARWEIMHGRRKC